MEVKPSGKLTDVNPELLNAWKEDFYKIVGVEKYDYWVVYKTL